MLELIAIALLQIASFSTPSTAPASANVNVVATPTETTPTDPTPTDTTPDEQGHGGWGGGII